MFRLPYLFALLTTAIASAVDGRPPSDAGLDPASAPVQGKFRGRPEIVVWVCGDVLELSVVPQGSSSLVRQWRLGRRPTQVELAPLITVVRSLFKGNQAEISAHRNVLFREVKDVMLAVAAEGFTEIVVFAVRSDEKPGPAIPHCVLEQAG